MEVPFLNSIVTIEVSLISFQFTIIFVVPSETPVNFPSESIVPTFVFVEIQLKLFVDIFLSIP